MKKPLFLLFLLTVFATNAQELTQDSQKTKVTFKIKNFGVNVDGRFGEVDIRTNFDSNNTENSYINATIAVKSIDTGNRSRDGHLLKEDYFNESTYENITLKSTKLEKKGSEVCMMTADLTIKGITKEIQIPIIFQETSELVLFQSSFQINRRDFEVGGGTMVMSKKVKIQVRYTGTK